MPLVNQSGTDGTAKTIANSSATQRHVMLGFFITAYSTAAGTITIKSGTTVLVTLSIGANNLGTVYRVDPSDLVRWDGLIAASEALTVTGATNVTWSGYVVYQDYPV